MSRFWQGVAAVCALLALAGLLTANRYRKLYLARPVLPTAPLVQPPETLKTRPDTVEITPPVVTAQLKALQATIRGFLADTVNRSADSCFALLGQADAVLDSFKRVAASKPAVSVTLGDTSLPYLWPTVRYLAWGDSAVTAWSYRFFADKWPRPPGPPPGRGIGRFGLGVGVFGPDVYGKAVIRFGQNSLLGVSRQFDKKRWGAEVSFFIF